MVKHTCDNCNIECETSVCPICHKKTRILESKIYWCDKCQAPTFFAKCPCCDNECIEVGSDLRPVFPEERLLLEVLLDSPFKYANSSIWNLGSNRYLIDGKKTLISYKGLREKNDPDLVSKKIAEFSEMNRKYIDTFFESKTIKNFINCNKKRLNYITLEALEYIKNKAQVLSLTLFKYIYKYL